MEEKPARVRVPQQKRSEETRQRILEAGRKLLCEEGYHATSSKKIAKEAGVSVGSFYSYFRDKKDLFLAINHDMTELIRDVISQDLDKLLFEGHDGRAMVRTIINKAVERHEAAPELHKQFMILMFEDDEVAAVMQKEKAQIVALLVAIFETHADILRVTDYQAAATVVVDAVEAVIHTVKFFDSPVEEERLINELGDMIHFFLIKEHDECCGE